MLLIKFLCLYFFFQIHARQFIYLHSGRTIRHLAATTRTKLSVQRRRYLDVRLRQHSKTMSRCTVTCTTTRAMTTKTMNITLVAGDDPIYLYITGMERRYTPNTLIFHLWLCRVTVLTVQAFNYCTSWPGVASDWLYEHPLITCQKVIQAHRWPT